MKRNATIVSIAPNRRGYCRRLDEKEGGNQTIQFSLDMKVGSHSVRVRQKQPRADNRLFTGSIEFKRRPASMMLRLF